MTSRPLVALGVIIIVIAVIVAFGYVINRGGNIPLDDGSPITASSSPVASSTDPATFVTPFASTTLTIPLPASADTTSWQMYVDNELGYSVQYPPNLVKSAVPGTLSLAFPKNSYFHWPLLDDAKITVSVATTCPAIIAASPDNQKSSFDLNGHSFTRTVGTDVGAGNRYLEVAYDTVSGGDCYHIYFMDHGTNGAGFYVDDSALIKKYDAQHDKDLDAVIAAMNGIAASFRVLAR